MGRRRSALVSVGLALVLLVIIRMSPEPAPSPRHARARTYPVPTKRPAVQPAPRHPPILILACDREEELAVSLHSIEKMKDSDEADVVVSFDCHMPNRSHLYNRYRSSFRSLRFVDSYQLNFQRDAWTDERVARHWVSAITRVLSVHPQVVYLEEDHVVMPDFIEAVDHYKKQNCSACFEVDIGCHLPCKSELSNMGVIYFQHTWMEFLENGFEGWCSRRGDWDHNLRKYTEEARMGSYRTDRTHVKHLHDCVSARTKRLHKNGVYCGKDRRMQLYREFLEEWEKDREKPFGGELVMSHKTVNNPGAPARMKEMCLGSIGSYKI